MVDSGGKQILPDVIGSQPPPDALPSPSTAGISCDLCHNTGGPDLNRSFTADGFANTSMIVNSSIEKVGPFTFPVGVKNQFHVCEQRSVEDLVSAQRRFCNSCHDVACARRGTGRSAALRRQRELA